LAEVAEVVKKLPGGRALGVDKIRLEMLKSLDLVLVSWLPCIFNVTWRSETIPVKWQTGMVITIFKKGDQRVCFNYKGVLLLCLPKKFYSRLLERRF